MQIINRGQFNNKNKRSREKHFNKDKRNNAEDIEIDMRILNNGNNSRGTLYNKL